MGDFNVCEKSQPNDYELLESLFLGSVNLFAGHVGSFRTHLDSVADHGVSNIDHVFTNIQCINVRRVDLRKEDLVMSDHLGSTFSVGT